jgi:hypothetical protein
MATINPMTASAMAISQLIAKANISGGKPKQANTERQKY